MNINILSETAIEIVILEDVKFVYTSNKALLHVRHEDNSAHFLEFYSGCELGIKVNRYKEYTITGFKCHKCGNPIAIIEYPNIRCPCSEGTILVRQRRLKPEYQELADTFDEDRGCTCPCGHPPCSWCTDEANPANLAENDEAWE